MATLRGKRLVITGELEECQRLSVSVLKQLGSADKLNIEEKYKQPESVRQSHALALFTNHLPRVGSTDNGTWRRLTVAPFQAVIPERDGVQNYAEVLARDAGEAMLSWAIEGAGNFIRNGCKPDIPDAVKEATDAYRQREDWLNRFMEERCVRDEYARTAARVRQGQGAVTLGRNCCQVTAKSGVFDSAATPGTVSAPMGVSFLLILILAVPEMIEKWAELLSFSRYLFDGQGNGYQFASKVYLYPKNRWQTAPK